jgi:hypothetical protein
VKTHLGCNQTYNSDEDELHFEQEQERIPERDVLLVRFFIAMLLLMCGLFLTFAVYAQTTIQTEPVYIESGKDNFLTGVVVTDIANPGGGTTTNPATHCGGFLYEGSLTGTNYTIPDTPLQTTDPRCKIKVTGMLKVGTMVWKACSFDAVHPTAAGVCNPTSLQFTVAQGSGTGPVQLAPPVNTRVEP